MEGYHSVKSVTRLTGINEHTLRAWERRYGAIKPKRSDNGRRYYDDSDLQRLQLLLVLTNRGHAIGKIATCDDSELRDLIQKYSPAMDIRSAEDMESEKKHIDGMLRELAKSLQKFSIESIHKEIKRARYSLSIRAFAIEFVAPLVRAVGELVALGKLTIAQEHVVSALLKAHLMSILADIGQSNAESRSSVMVATMEGDHHEIGILIGAALIVASGYEAIYVGPNMPPSALADAANAWKASAVLLGVTNMPETLLRYKRVDYMDRLNDSLTKGIGLWVGGATGWSQRPGQNANRSVVHLAGYTDLEKLL